MKTITREDALDGLRAVVDQFGADHVYEGPPDCPDTCVYAAEINGEVKPMCIVGHWFANLGVPPEDMVEWNFGIEVLSEEVDLATWDLKLDDDAAVCLAAAQNTQDGPADHPELRETWGAALRAAETVSYDDYDI